MAFATVEPTPVKEPRIIAASQSALALLGAPAGYAEAVQGDDGDVAAVFAGNTPFPGAVHAAHCYCGHQFGHFAGQLGDGAAIYAGRVQGQEVQFKGSGKTPYSRSADGRKVLRSSLREYLASEHMAALGIPTTRAAALVLSASTVVRDPQYDGNALAERCAVVTRVAPTFLRFGSFEVVKDTDKLTGRAGPSPGDVALLARLVDVTAQEHFPQLWAEHMPAGTEPAPLPSPAAGWDGSAPVPLTSGAAEDTAAPHRGKLLGAVFSEVAARTARLVAQWAGVGWCHGVLNTDNMSILGLTLDYGPYGFMDAMDFHHICNGSDDGGRYTYAKQAPVCRWNLQRLADCWRLLAPVELSQEATEALLQEAFDDTFAAAHTELFAAKLGLDLRPLEEAEAAAAAGGHSGTASLITSLMSLMHTTKADFTITFRALTRLPLPLPTHIATALRDALPGADTAPLPGVGWEDVQVEGGDDSTSTVQLPTGSEPVLRYIVQRCASLATQVAATKGRLPDEQLALFAQLLGAGDPRMRPHADTIRKELALRKRRAALQGLTQQQLTAANRKAWAEWLAVYSRRLAADAASAMPGPGAEADTCLPSALQVVRGRLDRSLAKCPRYVLRNYIAQAVITAVEGGDASALQAAQSVLLDPYDLKGPATATAFLSGYSPQAVVLAAAVDGTALPMPAADIAGAGCGTDEASGAGVCSAPGKIVAYDQEPPSWATGLCVTCSS